MKTRIATYVFLVIAIILGYALYSGVKGPIEEKARIEKAENKVIDKLVVIRECQKAYIKINGNYTNKWSELINFVENGKIPNIQVREVTIPAREVWLEDSTAFINDTLEILNARDVINNNLKKQFSKSGIDLTKFNSAELAYKPGTKEEFNLFAGKAEVGAMMSDVIEVTDKSPIDVTRKESNQMANRRPLKFGRRDEVSTAGNWE